MTRAESLVKSGASVPTLRQRIGAFLHPTPRPILVTSIDKWATTMSDLGWNVTLMRSNGVGFTVCADARQKGGPLVCKIEHAIYNKTTLGEALLEIDALVAGAPPDFAHAHAVRAPQVTIVSGATPA